MNALVEGVPALNSIQLQELLQYVKDEGRICPEPSKWHELWQLK